MATKPMTAARIRRLMTDRPPKGALPLSYEEEVALQTLRLLVERGVISGAAS